MAKRKRGAGAPKVGERVLDKLDAAADNLREYAARYSVSIPDSYIEAFYKAVNPDYSLYRDHGEGFKLTVLAHVDAIDEKGFKRGKGGVTNGLITEKLGGVEQDERQVRRHMEKRAYGPTLMAEIQRRIEESPALEARRITEFDRAVRIEILRRRLVADSEADYDTRTALARRIAAERLDALKQDDEPPGTDRTNKSRFRDRHRSDR